MENTNLKAEAASMAVQGNASIPQIMFYWDKNFGGENFLTSANTSYIGDHWNDQVSSFIINSGNWQFYQDANYTTPKGNILGPGRYPWVEDVGIPNDSISSYKCVSLTTTPIPATKSWSAVVTTPGITALGGNISIVANNNGDWTFTGHLHDSGFDPYHFDLVAVIVTPSGVAYTLTKSGHTEGTSSALPFGTPNRNCDWTTNGNNPAMKTNWSQVLNAHMFYKISTQDNTLNAISDMLNSLISEAVKSLGTLAVTAVIALI